MIHALSRRYWKGTRARNGSRTSITGVRAHKECKENGMRYVDDSRDVGFHGSAIQYIIDSLRY